MTATDQEALVTPIFYNYGRNGSGPALHVRKPMRLFSALTAEVGYLKNGDRSSPDRTEGSAEAAA